MKIIKQIIVEPLRKVQCIWEIIKYTLILLCKTNQRLFFFIIFFTMVGGICPAFLLIINQTLINTVQTRDIANINSSLYPFIFLSFLNILVQHIVNLLSNRFSMLLNYCVNCLIIEKCSNLSLKHFEKSEIYDMITRLENDTPVKPYEIFHSFLLFFQVMITFISVSVILFTWKLWVLISVLFLIILNIIIDVKLGNQEFEMKFQRSELERKSWYYSFLLTKDIAFKEIKIFGLKDFFLKKYKNIKSQFIKQDYQLYTKRTKIGIAISVIHECFVVIITVVAIKEIICGNILLGTGLSYLLAATLIEGNISKLSQQIYSIYQSSLYMRLLKSFLTLPIEDELSFCELENHQNSLSVFPKTHFVLASNEEIKVPIQLKTVDPLKIETIEVNHLFFDYDKKKGLQDVSFSVKAGETIAILGKNGSGKTTLLKLLCGLYDYDQGEILINGTNLKEINKETYWQSISVIFQNFFRYEGSLKENVIIGDIYENCESEKIASALNKAQVDFLLEDNGYTFKQNLGNWFDEGTQISEGQWQKICLSRVFYKNSSFYLLDEPTSFIDSFSESKIFEQILAKKDGITMFITHNFSIAKKAGKILLLEDGKLNSFGPPSSLKT